MKYLLRFSSDFFPMPSIYIYIFYFFIFPYHYMHMPLNWRRSACSILLKQQKLLLQLDWLFPYLLLLQLLSNKQLLPSHALLLELHLQPRWWLRWSHSSLARQKPSHGCGPFWNDCTQGRQRHMWSRSFWGHWTGRFWAQKCVLQYSRCWQMLMHRAKKVERWQKR